MDSIRAIQLAGTVYYYCRLLIIFTPWTNYILIDRNNKFLEIIKIFGKMDAWNTSGKTDCYFLCVQTKIQVSLLLRLDIPDAWFATRLRLTWRFTIRPKCLCPTVESNNLILIRCVSNIKINNKINATYKRFETELQTDQIWMVIGCIIALKEVFWCHLSVWEYIKDSRVKVLNHWENLQVYPKKLSKSEKWRAVIIIFTYCQILNAYFNFLISWKKCGSQLFSATNQNYNVNWLPKDKWIMSKS